MTGRTSRLRLEALVASSGHNCRLGQRGQLMRLASSGPSLSRYQKRTCDLDAEERPKVPPGQPRVRESCANGRLDCGIAVARVRPNCIRWSETYLIVLSRSQFHRANLLLHRPPHGCKRRSTHAEFEQLDEVRCHCRPRCCATTTCTGCLCLDPIQLVRPVPRLSRGHTLC